MDRLYDMTGVTDVGFSRSEQLGKSGSGLACGDSTRGSRFSLVAYFKPSPSQLAAAATPSTSTSTPTTPAAGTTGTATTPAAQPAATTGATP
jgi:hypothetical protein